MRPIDRNTVERMVNAWREAAQRLQFDIIAPYTLQSESSCIECIAYLPHFGRSAGMVIGLASPDGNWSSELLIQCARARGLFWSILGPIGYTDYNEEDFIETLCDWGYFGPPERRPPWFVDRYWGQSTEKRGQDNQGQAPI